MKKTLLASLITAGLFTASGANAIPVGLELALLVDVSGSVDAGEYNLQKTGYVNAFNDPTIQARIANTAGGIAVTYIEWSSAGEQATLVNWTHLTNAASSSAFATAIAGTARAFSGLTAPGSAINFATPLFSQNGFEGTRWVIDVSGDGQENDGANTAAARDSFLNTISVGEGSTKNVNGLAIGDAGLVAWYTANIKSPNGFVIQASDFNDFEAAVRTKIGRELPEPASLALLGLGFASLAAIRRRKSTK